MNAAYFGKPVVSSYYRTHSHAGFPKGSYAVPNPTHFHITRQTQIAKMKPLLVSIPPRATSSSYAYNRGLTTQSTITLNLGNHHPVAVDIPVDIIKGFVYPLAAALSIPSIPQLNNQGCQTTYMNNFERKPADLRKVNYTPLYIDNHRTCHFQSEATRHSQSFERQVLNDMQYNLLGDFSRSFSESDSESADSTNVPNQTLEEIKQFTEQDELRSNESLTELPEDLMKMLPSSSTDSTEEEGAAGCDSDNIKDVVKVAENFVDRLMDMSVNSVNYFLFERVINEAKSMLHQEPVEELPHSVNTISLDEGIEDCTLTNDSDNTTLKCSSPIDDRIKKIGYIILDYLVQQCFEVKELILFPEVLHDLNINKLLTKLKLVFQENYGNSLSDEEKNELRISIASYVLKLLEIDDRLKDTSQDSSSSIITDKIFTLSEFLSDVLDHFFNSLGNATFLDFEEQMGRENEGVFHSTPESKKRNKIRNVGEKNDTDSPEVTSFKKATKSGSETYWITLYDSPRRAELPEICTNKTIVNVDDIPLRPPEDYSEKTYSKRLLSPILEEPRANLFDSNISEYELEAYSDSFHEKYEILETPKENITTTENIDEVFPDENNTYVSFETPDSHVVIDNEVDFCRVETLTTTNTYIQVKEAEFNHKYSNSENKENEIPAGDVEGNWMGFEGAKF